MRKTQTCKSLPYNDALKDKAKALRKAGFLHEALLWNQLKSKNFNGLDFDRQKIIGNYIVDFYCVDKAVVIEVDGGSHNNTWIRGLLKNHPALTGTPPKEGNYRQPTFNKISSGEIHPRSES